MKRWEIINNLVKKNNYQTYLEIGSGNNDTFDNIIVSNKTSVDPNPNSASQLKMTSDEFFNQNNKTFDIIFIDGLHVYEQAKKDLINSLSCLNKNGTVVMHDCNPTTYEMQRTDTLVVGEWTGDVWRVIVDFKKNRDDLSIFVVDTDYGCGVIKNGKQKIINAPEDVDYSYFSENKIELLNLITIENFLNND
jgi:hypothetical protein